MAGAPSADGRFDVLAEACPTRQVVFRLGEKWTLLVLYALDRGPHRFGELQRNVEGISQRMLTQTVRNLERDGLVRRSVVPTVPSQVTYSLSPLGASLSAAISTIRTWAYGHMDEIASARINYESAE
ncbi:helix-turn-helix domain-containing protein [Nakamurella sp. A5-74]|uniref:Helix-turn-helix domain-containing protein n=1 Tax=Nakamurella sp. A5-74 TaxID=3158264 RepID=A0AAU8DPG6_9ACTN